MTCKSEPQSDCFQCDCAIRCMAPLSGDAWLQNHAVAALNRFAGVLWASPGPGSFGRSYLPIRAGAHIVRGRTDSLKYFEGGLPPASTVPPERLASLPQGCLLFPCATNPASPWSCSKAAARLCNLLRALSRSRQNKCNAAIRTTAVAAPLTGTQPVSVRLQPPPKQCPALSAVCFRGRRLPEYNTGPG